MRIRDVALKTYQRRWTIGRNGERGSGISVLAARQDDDDNDSVLKSWPCVIPYLWRRGWVKIYQSKKHFILSFSIIIYLFTFQFYIFSFFIYTKIVKKFLNLIQILDYICMVLTSTEMHTEIWIIFSSLIIFTNPSARAIQFSINRQFSSIWPINRALSIFTNPSARVGYNTRSFFKRSLTGLNSEFSFS